MKMEGLFEFEDFNTPAVEEKEQVVELEKVELKSEGLGLDYDDAFQRCVSYFNGDSLAANVFLGKYALKDSNENLFEAVPDDMHRRIANEFARIEAKYPNPLSADDIFELIKDFKYIIPQGSPMAGIGNHIQTGSLSNCFVIGSDKNSDSYGAIMKVDQEQVQLMKRRGGVGHDLSHIRPKGSPVKNSALTSTGIVPFMERYSNSTREVAQDGRRGALMLSVSVKHPDAEDFIDAKMEQNKVTGANVSVKLTDDFMRAVVMDEDFVQQYPIDAANPTHKKVIKARKLWNKIIHNAWKSAEPGVLFWDTIIREAIPDCYADLGFKTVSTNPCGEIPLCPYDSCRLIALNLYSYVDNPFTPNAVFNSALFSDHVRKAQRLNDDLIDLELEKIDRIIAKIESDPEDDETKSVELNLWLRIKEVSSMGRRTGLGITAEGDMIAALGLRYGSDDAIEYSVQVHKLLALEAYKSSVIMAKERGAFTLYDSRREVNNPLILRIKEAAPGLYAEMIKNGRRNISLLTIAPTGSVSILTQTTSGIEPVFMISYKRRRKVNPNDKNAEISFVDGVGDAFEEYNVFHPKFEVWLKENGYDIGVVKKYNDEDLQNVIAKSPYYKATANDIDWLSKVRMQGAVQKWVDHSISVTVNIPNDTSEELVGEIYKTAWEVGCKGMTVYRDGCRSGVLIANDDNKKADDVNVIKYKDAPSRPQRLDAKVVRFYNTDAKWIAVVGILNDVPYEVFTGKAEDFWLPEFIETGFIDKHINEDGSKRYDFVALDKHGYEIIYTGLSRSFDKEYWNYAKLISGVLRHGMPIINVVDLISTLNFDVDSINTWKAGVERALKQFIADGEKPKDPICPNCNTASLAYQEGCLVCTSCGYSKCG